MESMETSGSALATGSIASRFITQDDVDEAKERREQEWKDAYARIGQEPPSEIKESPSDGRTLFERLEEQKALKQEEWDNKMKMGNQYRGLQADEFEFLTDTLREKAEKEREVVDKDNAELQTYREALAKRQAADLAAAEPQITAGKSSGTTAKRVPVKAPKKDIKSLMKGVVVKKKAPASSSSSAAALAGKSSKRAVVEALQGDQKRKV